MRDQKTSLLIIGIVSVVSVATAIILQLPGNTADAAVLGVSVSGQPVVPASIQTINSFLYGPGYSSNSGAAAHAPSPDQAYAPQAQALAQAQSQSQSTQNTTSTPSSTMPGVLGSNDSTAPTAAGPVIMLTPFVPPTSTTSTATSTPIIISTSTVNALLPGEDPSSTISTSSLITLPYSVGTFGNHFTPGDGWVSWWGSPADASGTLDLAAGASSTGAGALLPASRDWLDYTFTANIDWVKGQTFGLVGRYVDGKNYVLCDFATSPSGVLMTLRQYVNGTSTNLATGDVYNEGGNGALGLDVTLQVQGGRGACQYDGHQISSLIAGTSITASSTPGGIGFTEWDPVKGGADVIVNRIGVAEGSYMLGPYDDQTTLYQ